MSLHGKHHFPLEVAHPVVEPEAPPSHQKWEDFMGFGMGFFVGFQR
jgi:hypothetical protein